MTRQEVAELIIAALRGTVTGAEEILLYRPDLAGRTPVIVLECLGSKISPLTAHGIQREHRFVLNVFVLRSGEGWTAEDAERKLNELHEQIARFVATNGGNTIRWGSLDMTDASNITYFVPEGGTVYLHESYPFAVRVFG